MRCMWCGRDVVPERVILGRVCPKCGQPLDTYSKHGDEKMNKENVGASGEKRAHLFGKELQSEGWFGFEIILTPEGELQLWFDNKYGIELDIPSVSTLDSFIAERYRRKTK